MAVFGGAVKLTGESEYRRALKQITQNLKEVSTEMKLVASQYDANDKSTKALTAQKEVLARKLEEETKKLNTLKAQYNDMRMTYSDNALKHQALVNEYNKERAELDRIGKTLGTTSKEYQDQEKKVLGLSKEVDKSTRTQEESERAMSKLRGEINLASIDCKNTEKEMDALNKTTKEQKKDAEEASKGWTVFKQVLADLTTTAIRAGIDGLKKLGQMAINVGKQALQSYSNYEQLVGGVETLFGDRGTESVEEYAELVGKTVDDVTDEYDKLKKAEALAMQNASVAYRTVGISANEYMQQMTSFSASLIQSLGGDTLKAVEYSNRAMVDMADNANKMGTDMASIQRAYQGFAKSNYTMLDNLNTMGAFVA